MRSRLKAGQKVKGRRGKRTFWRVESFRVSNCTRRAVELSGRRARDSKGLRLC